MLFAQSLYAGTIAHVWTHASDMVYNRSCSSTSTTSAECHSWAEDAARAGAKASAETLRLTGFLDTWENPRSSESGNAAAGLFAETSGIFTVLGPTGAATLTFELHLSARDSSGDPWASYTFRLADVARSGTLPAEETRFYFEVPFTFGQPIPFYARLEADSGQNYFV